MKVKIADLPAVKYNSGITDKQTFISDYLGIETDYRLREKRQKFKSVHNDFEGTHYHQNYLCCLETAWDNHYGVVITPDILWHTLLSEAVLIVGKDSAKYASLFTETPEKKQTVIVVTDELEVMPLDTLVEAIKPCVPTNSDVFLPEFSTSTDRSRMARYASFADLVSPFYNYMMMMCGIPYVDVRGTYDDYKKVADSWREVGKILSGNEKYFRKTQSILDKLLNKFDDPKFWGEIYFSRKCGSGSQTEAFGWWTELYSNPPEATRFTENFSSHLAKVSYKHLNTQKEYEMYHGVTHSRLVGDCLEPDFGCMVFEKLQSPIIKPLNEATKMSNDLSK